MRTVDVILIIVLLGRPDADISDIAEIVEPFDQPEIGRTRTCRIFLGLLKLGKIGIELVFQFPVIRSEIHKIACLNTSRFNCFKALAIFLRITPVKLICCKGVYFVIVQGKYHFGSGIISVESHIITI